jgi:eukaryotic translation initiation factor 2C
MVLDILVRFVPSLIYFTFGRSIFTPTDKTPFPNGAEAWHGFYQSVRPAKGKFMICFYSKNKR